MTNDLTRLAIVGIATLLPASGMAQDAFAENDAMFRTMVEHVAFRRPLAGR